MGSANPNGSPAEPSRGAPPAGEAGGAKHLQRNSGLIARFRAYTVVPAALPHAKNAPPPPAPPGGGAKQSITADALADAIRERDTKNLPRGIQFENLTVVGKLDLAHARMQNAIRFTGCDFECFSATDAVMFGLSFVDCALKGLAANGAIFNSDLSFQNCRVGPDGIVAENVRLGADCKIQSTVCTGPINFADAVVTGDVIVQDLTLRGQRLTLDDAVVGGSVRISDSDFAGSKLELGSMKVAFRLELQKMKHRPRNLFLTGTSTTTYKEDESAWPEPEGLYVDRFTYERLSVPNQKLERHLKWLRLQPRKHLGRKSFRSHPWRHLAALLKRRGSPADARVLSIKHRDAMLMAGAFGVTMTPVYGLFSVTCRYGLQPWLPVAWLFAFLIGGAVLFGAADKADLVTPSQASYILAMKNSATKNRLTAWPAEYPLFNCWLYSVENTLTGVNLGQKASYHVHAGRAVTDDPTPISMKGLRSVWAVDTADAFGASSLKTELGAGWLSFVLAFFIPAQAILGLLFVSLIVLSFSGVFERRLLN